MYLVIAFSNDNGINISGVQIPRYDVEQADVAPFMSTLLGTAPPVNNFGKLPYQYLNVSKVSFFFV